MAYTQLHPSAIPGKPYSFAPKTPASGDGSHAGLFTELSVLGTPGKRHVFSAKTPYIEPEPEPEPSEPAARVSGGGGVSVQLPKWRPHTIEEREQILREDEEMLILLCTILSEID